MIIVKYFAQNLLTGFKNMKVYLKCAQIATLLFLIETRFHCFHSKNCTNSPLISLNIHYLYVYSGIFSRWFVTPHLCHFFGDSNGWLLKNFSWPKNLIYYCIWRRSGFNLSIYFWYVCKEESLTIYFFVQANCKYMSGLKITLCTKTNVNTWHSVYFHEMAKMHCNIFIWQTCSFHTMQDLWHTKDFLCLYRTKMFN